MPIPYPVAIDGIQKKSSFPQGRRQPKNIGVDDEGVELIKESW